MTQAPARLIDHPRSLRHALDLAADSDAEIVFHGGSGGVERVLNYAALVDLAKQQARRMLAAGWRPGDRIGLIAETGIDFLAAFYGSQCAGLVPVPLPAAAFVGGLDAYREQIERKLTVCAATVLVAPDRLAAMLAPAMTIRTLSYRELDALPDAVRALPDDDTDRPAYIQFSSGSTSLPKGIVVTQPAVCRNAFEILTYGLGLTGDDRAFSWLPLYHDMGLVGFAIAPLIGRCPIHYLAPSSFVRRPGLWPELIGRHDCTISYAPPFAYRLAAQRAGAIDPAVRLDRWRVAGIGGDHVHADILDAFAEHFAPHGFRPDAFLPSYGLAETVLAVSFGRRGGPPTRRRQEDAPRPLIACGPPLPSIEVEIRDDHGHAAKTAHPGRIHVRGPSVLGYSVGDTGAAAQLLGEDGFLDTGDLGFVANGELFISGRAKDVIIHNGRNIWPADIEAEIEHRADIRFGNVVAFETWRGDIQMVTVLVEAAAKDGVARDALSAHVARIANSFCGMAVDVHIVPPHTIPRTSSGKIARQTASLAFLSSPPESAAPPSHRSSLHHE